MHRRETGGPRFITFSCHRRLALLAQDGIADVFARSLAAARRTHHLSLYAWVIMPEHVHLLCRPSPDRTMEEFLRSLKMSVAKQALEQWKQVRAPILSRIVDGDRPRFWQAGGGFDRNLRDEAEFAREVRYIHHNPVERGLVERPEQWKWSSVRWWMGLREGELECDIPPGPWQSWRGFV